MKKNKIFSTLLTITALVVATALPQAQAQEKKEPNQILITNVNVWDGRSDAVKMGIDVLIEGNLVKLVGAGIDAPKAHNAYLFTAQQDLGGFPETPVRGPAPFSRLRGLTMFSYVMAEFQNQGKHELGNGIGSVLRHI